MRIERIIFDDEVLKLFESQISKFGLVETGGVLLGAIKDDMVYVNKASDGGPKAIHERYYFRADSNYIDMFIEMEYANSDGNNVYLGEWHTHPQVEPEPSPLDLESLSDISLSKGNFSILVILGAVGYTWKEFRDQSISLISYSSGDLYILATCQKPD